MNTTKGFFALLFSAFLLGCYGIFIHILSNDFTAYQQMVFRHLIGFIIASIIFLLTKRQIHKGKVSFKILFNYAFSYILSTTFFVFAILHTTVINTIFSFYIGSLTLSLLIGRLIFKESLDRMKILSLLLVFVGLFIYAYPFNSGIFNIAFLFAFLGGVGDAIANSSRKFLTDKFDRISLVIIQMLGGIALSLLLVLINHEYVISHISQMSWLIGILYGFCLVGVSYFILIGFRNFDLNLGTIVLCSEIFFGALLAFLFLHETVSIEQIIGSIIIIIATFLTNLKTDIKLLNNTGENKLN